MLRNDPDGEGPYQFDFFVPHLSDINLRDQRETMERPFFNLAKRKRLKPIDYKSPDGDIWVKVEAIPAYGMATIWDADILIWAASVLTEMKNAGKNDLPRTLIFHPHNLLKGIKRSTSGTDYERLRAGLDRLKTTVITTNIRAKGRKRYRKFGWIDQWTEEVEESTNRTKHMTITLSDWMYEGIIQDGGVLAIHPDYFLLTGGLERCLYRVARKHVGRQNIPWFISLSTLYTKTGSSGTPKEFTRMIRKIAQEDSLPEYHLFLTTKNGAGELSVGFSRRKALRPVGRPALLQPPPSERKSVNSPRRRRSI